MLRELVSNMGEHQHHLGLVKLSVGPLHWGLEWGLRVFISNKFLCCRSQDHTSFCFTDRHTATLQVTPSITALSKHRYQMPGSRCVWGVCVCVCVWQKTEDYDLSSTEIRNVFLLFGPEICGIWKNKPSSKRGHQVPLKVQKWGTQVCSRVCLAQPRGSRGQNGRRGREGSSHRPERKTLGCGCGCGWVRKSSCLKMAKQERSADLEAFLKPIISLPLLEISQGSVMTK